MIKHVSSKLCCRPWPTRFTSSFPYSLGTVAQGKRIIHVDDCAVLVAEDITSRFLNVISLFNGVLPMVALQMQALKIGDYTTRVFTKVMDELARGLEEEDEPEAAPVDRSYWEKRSSK